MRCVHDKRFGYLFNSWSDGYEVYRNESQSGITWKAMQSAAESSKDIAARVTLFQHRLPEELFDFNADPNSLRNLAQEPGYQDDLRRLRARLLEHLKAIEDPHYEALQRLTSR